MKDVLNPEKNDILTIISKHRSAIMGFAALCIFVFHEFIPIGQENGKLFIIQQLVQARCFVGVDIFFLLSGMGLTYAIKKTNVGMFYYKRLRRVVFPFVAVGAGILLARRWSFIEFIKNVSGYNFLFLKVNSFLWFVPAIMIFYLLFPLYNKLMQKASNKITFTALMISIWLIVSMLSAGFIISHGREDIYGVTNRIPIFIIGILLGYLSQNQKIYMTKAGWALMVIMNITGFYLGVMTTDQDWDLLVPIPNCCVPNILMSFSAVFILAGMLEWISHFKISKPINAFFNFFGMISLEFYCIQEALGSVIKKKIADQSSVIQNAAVFAGCIAAALIIYFAEKYFWKLVELPFGKKDKKETA